MSLRTVAGVLAVVGTFAAGYFTHRVTTEAAPHGTQVTAYTCPMHPQYRSDHPGDCPICGMRLVPSGTVGSSPAMPAAAVMPGAVVVSAEKQQLMGIRTEAVQSAPLAHALRVPGRVAIDEQRQYRIIAAADGWLRNLGQNPAGTYVRKDQVLASYYAQNLITAAQTYVYALQTNAQAQTGDATIGYQRGTTVLSLLVARDSLRALGMSEFQIEEIERTRVAPTEVRVQSPASGFVIARNITPGQRFDKGTELYRIADIGHVWVMADFFEKDREFLKPGSRATVLYQGHEYQARMSNALPQFDPQSRTLKTRFELDNPGYVLRPDMFVDVQLHVSVPAMVTVPADAVVDSGRERTVFVARGEGAFEPRRVTTGWRLGDRVQITKGVEPGERIVVAGTFLIDSESRMTTAGVTGAPQAISAQLQKDPVCGMDVDPGAPGAIRLERGDRTWHFCSEHCKRAFAADPDRYAPHVAPAGAGGHPGPT